MHHLTLYPALAGGSMIGLSAVLYLFLTGRYVGISGMLRGIFFGTNPDRSMDALFAGGLIVGGAAWLALRAPFVLKPSGVSVEAVAIGGLLVGFGTALGRGCTSGHGVCGLGRLSKRSLIAVLTFLTSGIVTVFVVRHVF